MSSVEEEIEAEVAALQVNLREEDAPHSLWFVSEFRTHRTGWQQHDHGGATPIIEDLPEPYWRWYCRCGSIGGKQPTEGRARISHRQHRKEREAQPTG